MSNDDPTTTPLSPRQVLLGLFIVGQLAFLIVSNLLGFVKWVPTEVSTEAQQRINQVLPPFGDQKGHAWEWADEIETGIRRYTQLTLQDQDWALFAPSVGKATGFPAVLFRWDEATPDDTTLAGAQFTFDAKTGFHMQIGALPRSVVLQSDNEPNDVRAYLRLDKCRVRRLDGQFWLNPEPRKDESQQDAASRLTQRVQTLAKDQHDLILAYLHWRLKTWQAAHPREAAPKQVILLERFYRIHGPDEERGWDGPAVIPIVRWLPKLKRSEHAYVLEAFDFTDKQFVVLK